MQVHFRWVRLLTLAAGGLAAMGMPAPLQGQAVPELTTVRQIRTLTPDEAAKARPVRLRGVVTTFSGWKNWFFFQDATGGLSIERTSDLALVQASQRVELHGVTGPGQFAPIVTADQITVLGKGALPPARVMGLNQLLGGKQDAQWLAVRGVVRSAVIKKIWDHSVLVLGIDLGQGYLVSARVANFSGADWKRLPASTVTVRGVCGTVFNGRRQFIGLRMYVPSLSEVKVERPALADPFSLPLRSLAALSQFGDQAEATQRIKVRGTVTYAPPGQGFYLQDGRQGVFVDSDQTSPLAVGAQVEVVGYPAAGHYAPTLDDAVFRVVGPAQPLAVLPQSAAGMVLADENGFPQAPFDALLVQLKGRLIEQVPGTREDMLLLEEGGTVFAARLPLSGNKRIELSAGSLLQVTGICVAKADKAHEARSFELLLRSPADLVVIKNAPWWTPNHAWWVVAFLLFVILGMFGWLANVRRQDSLRALAVTDHLTGLYNRRGFFVLAGHQWQLALRNRTSILLFFIDVDRFKPINDRLGHKEGDRALRDVADALRQCFRSTDIIGRMGGDEFAITTGDASLESRATIEQRLAAIIEQKNNSAVRAYKLVLSIGVLKCDSSMQNLSIEDLLAKADTLMYAQKREHKSRKA
jgi:diguanylate cyclase (GGDEF)-like protein